MNFSLGVQTLISNFLLGNSSMFNWPIKFNIPQTEFMTTLHPI